MKTLIGAIIGITTIAVLFGLVGGPIPALAFAQGRRDVADILGSVSRVYTTLNSYRFDATVIEETQVSGKTSVTEAKIVVAVQEPERIRFEVFGSGATEFTGIYVGDELALSDGTEFFFYLPKYNQYTKKLVHSVPFASDPVTPMGTVSAFIDHIDSTFFGWYMVVAKFADRARLLRDESIKANGSLVDCYVIEIDEPPNPRRTVWVDKAHSIVLKEILDLRNPGNLPSETKTTSFTVAQFDGMPPSALFVFSPPAGAKQVKTFGKK